MWEELELYFTDLQKWNLAIICSSMSYPWHFFFVKRCFAPLQTVYSKPLWSVENLTKQNKWIVINGIWKSEISPSVLLFILFTGMKNLYFLLFCFIFFSFFLFSPLCFSFFLIFIYLFIYSSFLHRNCFAFFFFVLLLLLFCFVFSVFLVFLFAIRRGLFFECPSWRSIKN